MADQQFCLRWNNHQNTLVSVFDSLLESGILVDCTLAAEGQFLRAHKVVLSACSPFLSDLLRQDYEKHPILIMKDVKFTQLKAMLDYMYRGEVNISQDQLGMFLKAAESLQIKGLSDSTHGSAAGDKTKPSPSTLKASRGLSSEDDTSVPRPASTSPSPRRRKRRRHSGSDDESVRVGESVESASESVSESSVPPVSSKSSGNINSVSTTQGSSPAVQCRAEESPQSDQVCGMSSSQARELPSSVSQPFRSETLPQQSPSPIDSALIQPKTEFLEVDSVEELTMDEDNMEMSQAGPSHGDSSSGGFPWHIERTEDAFHAAQESHSSHRNAQVGKICGSSSAPPWPDPHECPICGRLYKYRSTLYRHVRYECGGARMKLVCPICGRRFSRPDNLRQHAITHTNAHSMSSGASCVEATTVSSKGYSDYSS